MVVGQFFLSFFPFSSEQFGTALPISPPFFCFSSLPSIEDGEETGRGYVLIAGREDGFEDAYDLM